MYLFAIHKIYNYYITYCLYITCKIHFYNFSIMMNFCISYILTTRNSNYITQCKINSTIVNKYYIIFNNFYRSNFNYILNNYFNLLYYCYISSIISYCILVAISFSLFCLIKLLFLELLKLHHLSFGYLYSKSIL